MRESLFRGKTKEGYWAIGAYASHIDSIYDFSRKRMYKVCPETIGQYTGLTDRNGKNIFDGDIVYCSSTRAQRSAVNCKKVNKCKMFEFNEIDVFDLDKIYKPQKKQSSELQQVELKLD